ncbi:MAG: hypothetical protein R2851_26750 [Caldilineaceae bacterium]
MLQIQLLLLDQFAMDLSTMITGFLLPCGDRAFVQVKGRNNGLQRAAMRQERRHVHKEFGRLLDAVHGRPTSLAERLLAAGALVALFLPVMHHNIAAANFAAGVTG